MASLPEHAAAALSAADPTPVAAAVRTDGAWPLGPLHPERPIGALWVVVTRAAAWVVAATASDAALVAAVGPSDVARQAGWTADTLRVGPFELPVPLPRRPAAVAVAEAAAALPDTGPRQTPSWPSLPPRGDAVAREGVAAAAVGVPPWWADTVPRAPDERWLHALPTAATAPMPTPTGALAAATLWVGLTERSAVLVAALDGPLAARPLADRPRRVVRNARQLLFADDARLPLPLLGPRGHLVGALGPLDPSGRWAALAEHHLDRSRPTEAGLAWREALRRGEGDACWPGIARAAWVAGDLPRAVRALHRALAAEILQAEDRAAWSLPLSAKGRPDATGMTVALAAAAEEIDAAAPAHSWPEGLPRPESPDELWLGVHALRNDRAAHTVLADLGPTPRTATLAAALADLRRTGPPDPGPWRAAARAWRVAGDTSRALDALARVLPLDRPEDHWTRASWAVADGREAEADDALQAALAADPTGAALTEHAFDAGGWRRVATQATAAEAWTLAARAWARVLDAQPDNVEALAARAALLEGPLDRPDAAAALYETLAPLLEPEDAPRVPALNALGAWLAAARRRRGPAVEAALQRAARHAPLHPELWRAFLTRHADQVRPELGLRWQHVAAAVLGGVAPEPLPTAEHPDIRGLDPGDTPWLDRLATFASPEPPSRAALVRGLDRLDKVDPDAAARAQRLAERLGVSGVAFFVARGEAPWGAVAWPTSPPVVLVGADHLHPDSPRHLAGPALDALIAIELAHLAADHPLLHLDLRGDGARSVYAAFGRFAGAAEGLVDLVTLVPGVDQITRIERILRATRRVFAARSALERATTLAAPVLSRLLPVETSAEPPTTSAPLTRQGLAGSALRARFHADRIALALTGDLAATLRAVIASARRGDEAAPRLEPEGLAAVLEARLLPDDVALRAAALVAFAASPPAAASSS